MPIASKLACVLLVDDHPTVRRLAPYVLAGEFRVAAALPNGELLDAAVATHQPDLIVFDITLPGASGIDLARRLTATGCAAKIVFLTVHRDEEYVRAAFAAGATGYVDKERLVSDLRPALRAALAGRRFVSPGERGEEAQ